MKRDRPAAPIIDLLLEEFDYFRDASVPSQQLYAAMDSLFAVLRELAPSGRNKEVKSIWITIPRGNISCRTADEKQYYRKYRNLKAQKPFCFVNRMSIATLCLL